MLPRIVEVATDNRHLKLHRGFMLVMHGDLEIGRVAVSDMCALIVNSHGITYSNDLVVALCQSNIPIVLNGSNHKPVGWLWPMEGNVIQAKRMDAQLSCSKPHKKRLWQQIVKAKIRSQSLVLEALGLNAIPISSLINKVKSGDTTNVEAQAAQRYWKILFGHQFRRDRNEHGINALLNYGYTIIRSAVARAITGAGLHPTISLAHKNKYNAFRLVDDLIEPFRSVVDHCVYLLANKKDFIELSPPIKEKLVNLLFHPIQGRRGTTSLINVIHEVVNSLVSAYESPNQQLWLPAEFLLNHNKVSNDAKWSPANVDITHI